MRTQAEITRNVAALLKAYKRLGLRARVIIDGDKIEAVEDNSLSGIETAQTAPEDPWVDFARS